MQAAGLVHLHTVGRHIFHCGLRQQTFQAPIERPFIKRTEGERLECTFTNEGFLFLLFMNSCESGESELDEGGGSNYLFDSWLMRADVLMNSF